MFIIIISKTEHPKLKNKPYCWSRERGTWVELERGRKYFPSATFCSFAIRVHKIMAAAAAEGGFRTETDSMGEVQVAHDRYYGAQTQRSIGNFPIGVGKYTWDRSVIKSLGVLKKAAALANKDLGQITPDIADLIVAAANEVIEGALDDHFPLVVFQTGSGTQSNMNANEVISNRAIEMAGGVMGSKSPVNPNDHVNRGQSSNDTFPTAMHLAAVDTIERILLPAVSRLRTTLDEKAKLYTDVVKIGRTHLQDATPITLGQEISGWVAQIDACIACVSQSLGPLYELAIGGTAVGTGLNAHKDFGRLAAHYMAQETGYPFVSAPNKFYSLAAHDALVGASAAIRMLASGLFRIANDVRRLASGPRAGIGEITIPENEPGSSIMPGKVNPTQCEALTMVCVQCIGNDAAVAFAGTQGDYQLNVYKPVMVYNVLESAKLLAEASLSFEERCVSGLEPNMKRINFNLSNSLMVVTALNVHIGYDKAAKIAKMAHIEETSLKEAAVASGYVTSEEFDAWVVPKEMTTPLP